MSEGEEKQHSWYESNSFWSPFSIFVGLICTVVGLMMADVRWLLWVSLFFFAIAASSFARGRRPAKWIFAIVAFVVVTVGIGFLYHYTKPTPHPASLPTPPPPKSSAPKPSAPTSTQIPTKRHPAHRQANTPTQSTSQSGTSNQQTVIQPGATVQQQSEGPCSPNIIGSNNSNVCGSLSRKIDPVELKDSVSTIIGIDGSAWNDGTTEPGRLAEQIVAGLNAAGWHIGGHNIQLGNPVSSPTNLTIEVCPESDSTYGEAAGLLKKALKKQGVDSEIVENSRFQKNFLKIMVSTQ